MKPVADIFGGALSDYFYGDVESQITVRRDDDFLDTHSPGIWLAEKLWPAEEPLMPAISGRVLDVGCGAGRHMIPLQNADVAVTGIDASPLAVEICRARGCRSVIGGDVFEVALEDTAYDTVLLFGNNVGIGGAPERIVELMRKLRGCVRDGGQLLIASLDVSKTDNPVHRVYHDALREAGAPIGQIRIRLEYKDRLGPWFDWLHPQPHELEEFALASGWSLQTLVPFETGPYAAVLAA